MIQMPVAVYDRANRQIRLLREGDDLLRMLNVTAGVDYDQSVRRANYHAVAVRLLIGNENSGNQVNSRCNSRASRIRGSGMQHTQAATQQKLDHRLRLLRERRGHDFLFDAV